MGGYNFDVAGSFRLLPVFDEEDPDIFFALFEHVADGKKWLDGHRTMMLQCVFTSKAKRAFSALSLVDSGD